MRLTDITVRNLPVPENGQKSYGDEGVPGFACRVSQGGTKTFVLMHGRDRQLITIGRYPTITLADARTEAKRLLAEKTLGKHRPARMAATEALTRFLGEQKQKNRANTVRETEALIRNHFPKLLLKSLEDVNTDDVTKITDKLLKKEQPGAASHAFTAVRTFLRWCVKRRYIHHSPIEGIELPAKSKTRERVLTDTELCTVWRAADKTGYPFGDIVKLLILTGQRRSEIGSLRADHIKDNSICLPSELTKNKRSHTFPIGTLTASCLQMGHPHDPTNFLFPAQGKSLTPFNGWSKAKARLDKKIADQFPGAGKLVPWTLHDLRRTYATNLQRLGVSIEVIEQLLNHISGTRAGIVGVYQKHKYEPEMRAAVTTYENWLQALIATE